MTKKKQEDDKVETIDLHSCLICHCQLSKEEKKNLFCNNCRIKYYSNEQRDNDSSWC